MKQSLQNLEEAGIKPSFQRIKVYEFLWKNRIHPTVDEIFNALVSEIPTLSRTTIYNTLKLFQEKGLVISLTIEENEIRYDIDISNHGHFKCGTCGKVYDFTLEQEVTEPPELEGFLCTQKHLYYRGICRECLRIGSNKKLSIKNI